MPSPRWIEGGEARRVTVNGSDGVAVGVALVVGVSEAVAVEDGSGVGVSETVAVRVGRGVSVPGGTGVSDGVTVEEGSAVMVSVGVSVWVSVGVSVGVSTTCLAGAAWTAPTGPRSIDRMTAIARPRWNAGRRMCLAARRGQRGKVREGLDAGEEGIEAIMIPFER